MNKPFQIEVGEWWFKGCFIQEQNQPKLHKYVIFADTEEQEHLGTSNTFSGAIKICKENEVKDYKLGIKAFGFSEPLGAKYKTYELTVYHRGIELKLLCVTTSKKKFAELSNNSISFLNGYVHTYDLRYPICNENPDKLFATRGFGGEGTYIFEKDLIKPYEEIKEIIDKHREKYSSYNEYLNSLKKG
jgi:hypothetical protein